jgi:hypothetical protein
MPFPKYALIPFALPKINDAEKSLRKKNQNHCTLLHIHIFILHSTLLFMYEIFTIQYFYCISLRQFLRVDALPRLTPFFITLAAAPAAAQYLSPLPFLPSLSYHYQFAPPVPPTTPPPPNPVLPPFSDLLDPGL